VARVRQKKVDERIVEPEEGGNHNTPVEVLDAVASIRKAVSDLVEQVNDLATKKDASGETQLFIAKSLLDPDREHLSGMTRLYMRSVRTFSLKDMSASVFDPYVQSGMLGLCQVRGDSYKLHMRSVGGDLTNKTHELAMEQLRVTENREPYEETELGKGV
jgi:hypothetical protein